MTNNPKLFEEDDKAKIRGPIIKCKCSHADYEHSDDGHSLAECNECDCSWWEIEKKCSKCGQSRPKVPIFVKGVVGLVGFETMKCRNCGRLPADNPAVIQGMKWREEGEMG